MGQLQCDSNLSSPAISQLSDPIYTDTFTTYLSTTNRRQVNKDWIFQQEHVSLHLSQWQRTVKQPRDESFAHST